MFKMDCFYFLYLVYIYFSIQILYKVLIFINNKTGRYSKWAKEGAGFLYQLEKLYKIIIRS